MSLRKAILALLFWIAVLRLHALGQTEVSMLKLGLTDVLQQAETRNLELQAAKKNIALAQAGKTIAEATLNPRLSCDYPFGLAEPKRTLTLEQPIELGGKRPARVALARDQIRQAELQYDLLRWQVRQEARQAYFELVVSKAARNEAERVVSIDGELLEIAKKRFAAGDIAEAEVIQAQFALERTRPRLGSAINRVRQAEIRLGFILGQPPGTSITPTDELNLLNQQSFALSEIQIPPLTVLLDQANRSRLELLIAAHQVRLSADQIALARSGKIPDLAIAGGYIVDPSIPATSTLVGIRLDLPIFNTHQGELDQALASRQFAVQQLSVLERQIRMEVESAYENYTAAKSVLETDLSKILPESQQVLELANKSYQLGQTSLTDVLVARQSVQDARDAIFADILNYETASGALERAVNQPLTEGKNNATTHP